MNDGYLSLGSGIWNFRVVVARNVPFDFQFFEDKEALQLASYQIAEDNESLREYVGLDGSRLILLVQHIKGILTSSGTKATPESITTYIKSHIKFHDKKRELTTATVSQLLNIGTMLSKSPKAQRVADMAENTWGRDTLFDEYSKVLLVVNKSCTSAECEFLFEGLFVMMCRSNNQDQPSKADLQSKSGEISVLQFIMRTAHHVLKKYQFTPENATQQALMERAQAVFTSPLQCHIEFPKDAVSQSTIWMTGLPDGYRALLEWFRDVSAGVYNQQLKGLLASPPPGGATPPHFLKIDTIARIFEAIDRLCGGPQHKDPEAGGGSGGKCDQQDGVKDEGDCDKDSMQKVHADAASKADATLSAKLVVLSHDVNTTLTALVQAQDVTSLDARWMGFYDPKNAALARTYKGQSWFQRVPGLSKDHFSHWLQAPGLKSREPHNKH